MEAQLLKQSASHDRDLERILSLLSLLWKFNLTVLTQGDEYPIPHHHPGCIFIDYEHEDLDFESWCGGIIDSHRDAHCLIIDRVPKTYGHLFRNVFGVGGIKPLSVVRERRFEVDREDILTKGLSAAVCVKPIANSRCGSIVLESAEGLITSSRTGECLLARKDRFLCLSAPVWQLGVPGFPEFFSIMRGFLFIQGGLGHFSPFPYVSMRVDDLPLTSQQYLQSGGAVDEAQAEDVEQLCTWSATLGAKLEFMVNSRIVEANGVARGLEEVVPKSVAVLKAYFMNGFVNVNAHGMTHLEQNEVQPRRNLSPCEFKNLGDEETRAHLVDNASWLARRMGKTASGFVPPSWAYREGLTKRVCADYFNFIIDSAQNYRAFPDCRPLGHVDGNGLLHLLETWHVSGSSGFDFRDGAPWRHFIRNGIPVHMMVHGAYISDPLPRNRLCRWLALALLSPLILGRAFLGPRRRPLFRQLNSSIRWRRLDAFRRFLVKLPGFRRSSVKSLIVAGTRNGARWSFTEELADHLREYHALSLPQGHCGNNGHRFHFSMDRDCKRPFLFHLPDARSSVKLDGITIMDRFGDAALLPCLTRGEHVLEMTNGHH